MKLELDNGEIEYIPDFISIAHANNLLKHFIETTPWNQGQINMFGKKIAIPRLEAFYAEDERSYSYSGQKLQTNSLTDELKKLILMVDPEKAKKFNSVLLNLYRDGNDSNGWHADNEKELGKNPFIASLSLGSARNFELKHQHSGQKIKLELTHGSLLLMGGEIQHFWKHQISKDKKIHTPRINLTFRHII